MLEPVARKLGTLRSPEVVRFENTALVANKFVDVAFVVVEFVFD